MQEIKADRLCGLAQAGLIGTMCPDGNYSLEIFNHLSGFTERPHLPSLNGGAMLLAPGHPNHQRDGKAIIASIEGAWSMGKGKAIILLSHYPCGLAGIIGYSAQDIIRDTLAADDYLTSLLGLAEEIVLPLFHIDWQPDAKVGEKHCRTYVIKNKCRQMI